MIDILKESVNVVVFLDTRRKERDSLCVGSRERDLVILSVFVAVFFVVKDGLGVATFVRDGVGGGVADRLTNTDGDALKEGERERLKLGDSVVVKLGVSVAESLFSSDGLLDRDCETVSVDVVDSETL